MGGYAEIFKGMLLRLVIAAPIFIIGWRKMTRQESMLQAASGLLVGMGCMVLAAVILAYPLARLMAEPVGDLYYPGRRKRKPGPLYSVAEAKTARGQYEEALGIYEKISGEFPQELKPYVEMLRVTAIYLRDMKRADRIFDKAMSALEKEEHRSALASVYKSITAKLKR